MKKEENGRRMMEEKESEEGRRILRIIRMDIKKTGRSRGRSERRKGIREEM